MELKSKLALAAQWLGICGGSFFVTTGMITAVPARSTYVPAAIPAVASVGSGTIELRNASAALDTGAIIGPPVPAKPKPQKPKARPKIVAVDRRIAERADQLQPGVKKRLVQAAKKLPEKVTLVVTSAYRTSEEQAALQPTFGVKAKPGTSTHEHGRGIDLNILVDGERVNPRKQQRIIGEAMADAGFRHLGPIDPVHYSIPASALEPETEEGPVLALPTMDELATLEAELNVGE